MCDICVRYKMLKLTKTSHISRPGPIARSLYQIIGLSSNISPPFSPTRSSSSSCTARVRPLLRRGILPLETASAIPRTLRSTRFFVGAGAQQQPTTPIARSAATTIGSHVSTCELLTTLPDALATISAVSWMYGWSCCWPSSIICSAATNFETLPFIAARARLLSVGGGGDGGGGGAGGGGRAQSTTRFAMHPPCDHSHSCAVPWWALLTKKVLHVDVVRHLRARVGRLEVLASSRPSTPHA